MFLILQVKQPKPACWMMSDTEEEGEKSEDSES